METSSDTIKPKNQPSVKAGQPQSVHPTGFGNPISITLLAIVLACFLHSAPAHAQADSIQAPAKNVTHGRVDTLNLASTQLWDKRERGPITLVFTGVNRLRYEVVFQINTTTIPNRLAVALPSFGDASPLAVFVSWTAILDRLASTGGTFSLGTSTHDVSAFASIVPVPDTSDALPVLELLDSIDGTLRLARVTSRELESVIRHSDEMLGTGGIPGLLQQLDAIQRQMEVVLAFEWPETELRVGQILLKAAEDRERIAQMADPDASEVGRAPVFAMVRSRLEAHLEAADSFARIQSEFAYWNLLVDRIRNDGGNAFVESIPLPCRENEIGTRRYTIRVVKNERRSGGARSVGEDVATIECPASVSVSVGVGLSLAKRVEISELPSPDSTMANVTRREYGFAREEYVRPMPLLLVNLRGGESWHVSVGAVGKVSSDGANPEPVVGFSRQLRGGILASLLVHLYEATRLQDGFAEGSAVPVGLDDLPTVERQTIGVMLSLSYQR